MWLFPAFQEYKTWSKQDWQVPLLKNSVWWWIEWFSVSYFWDPYNSRSASHQVEKLLECWWVILRKVVNRLKSKCYHEQHTNRASPWNKRQLSFPHKAQEPIFYVNKYNHGTNRIQSYHHSNWYAKQNSSHRNRIGKVGVYTGLDKTF